MARKDSYGCRTSRRVCAPAAIVALGMSLLLAWGCESKQTPPKAPEKPRTAVVYTTFYPTTYFAERIAGDNVKVVNPCPADADPAYWMPDDKTIEAYQGAALVVINGASFEKWVDKVNLPTSRLVDTTKPFADKFIHFKDAVTHTHGPEGEHTHEGIDGHTWLDPINAKAQAEQIKKALIKEFPEHKAAFEAGYQALAKDLDALDVRLKAVSAKMSGQVLYCSHPAYNFIGWRYNWQLRNFHLDPEEMPDQAAFDAIKEALAAQPAKHMLWEAEPLKEIAEKMRKELGLESIVFSPGEALEAAQLDKGEDFLSVMNRNVDRLEQSFGG